MGGIQFALPFATFEDAADDNEKYWYEKDGQHSGGNHPAHHAGADGALTQYFYNADAYFRFVDDVRRMGIDIPIVPGIMPISNFTQLRRFSDACGAEIPRWVGKRMLGYGDDVQAIREFAADFVADLCRRLLTGGAPSLHFYTLNLSKPTLNVLAKMA